MSRSSSVKESGLLFNKDLGESRKNNIVQINCNEWARVSWQCKSTKS